MAPTAVADPAQFCRAVAEASITRVTVTPTLLTAILHDPELTALTARVLTWISSGEPFWPELGNTFNSCFPEARLVNVFGTQGLGPCLAWEVPKSNVVEKGIRLGQPLPNIRAYVINKSTQLSAVGIAGRLCIAVDDQPSNPASDSIPVDIVDDAGTLLLSETLIDTGVSARRWNDGSIEYLDPPENAFGLQTERLIRKIARTSAAAVVNTASGMRIGCIYAPPGRSGSAPGT